MVYGVKGLRKIQIGQETTAGTAVAATTIWRGNGVIRDAREITIVEEDIGLLTGQGRSFVGRLLAQLEMEDTPATFEQLPYILCAGLMADTDGSADGGGSGYIYTYNLSTNAQATPKTFTIEQGDNARVDEMEYSVVTEWRLSGAPGEALQMSASWIGRQSTDAEFTAGQSVPSVEEILFGKGKLYIDATTIGTTQKTGTFLGFELTGVSGFQAVESADGNLYFYAIKQGSPKITGVLILEHDATGEAEINAARAETNRLIRMVFEGSALTTAGTAYTYKSLVIDAPIKYTEVPAVEDQDGDDVVRLPFEVIFDGTNNFSIVVVNQLANLT